MYTLDTNVVLYYLNKEEEVISLISNLVAQNSALTVATVSEVELFAYPNLSETEETNIRNILKTIYSIPLDSRIANQAAILKRTHTMKLGDSIIAATAVLTGSTLLTRNVRDFKKIPGLKLQKI